MPRNTAPNTHSGMLKKLLAVGKRSTNTRKTPSIRSEMPALRGTTCRSSSVAITAGMTVMNSRNQRKRTRPSDPFDLSAEQVEDDDAEDGPDVGRRRQRPGDQSPDLAVLHLRREEVELPDGDGADRPDDHRDDREATDEDRGRHVDGSDAEPRVRLAHGSGRNGPCGLNPAKRTGCPSPSGPDPHLVVRPQLSAGRVDVGAAVVPDRRVHAQLVESIAEIGDPAAGVPRTG